jgi:hypothetical protein
MSGDVNVIQVIAAAAGTTRCFVLFFLPLERVLLHLLVEFIDDMG